MWMPTGGISTARLGGQNVPPHFPLVPPTNRTLMPHRVPAVQVLIVGDFNVAAEPRDVHPALGAFADIYGQEELAALHSLTASYPGGWGGSSSGGGWVGGWEAAAAAPLGTGALIVFLRTCTPPAAQMCGGGCTPRQLGCTACGMRRQAPAPSTR